jgi:IMP dehydrogenase/GMP reductase
VENNNNMQLDFNDLVLVQKPVGLNSRSEVNLEYFPIFNAPMDTVLSKDNAQVFKNAGINLCFPRNAGVEVNEEDFISVGLVEFEEMIKSIDLNHKKICIDVANGNMPALHNAIRNAKSKYPNVIIMSGNIASKEAFVALASTGCDYIRAGVGSGSGCLTSVHTAVGQGMATLIADCKSSLSALKMVKPHINTQIVADGGFRTYRDVILALALGADYVMLGGILNKTLESCSQKSIVMYDDEDQSKVTDILRVKEDGTLEFTSDLTNTSYEFILDTDVSSLIKYRMITSTFRGMSTKSVQKDWGKTEFRSSEGIEKINYVEYTLAGWIENFQDYLKSAMSYSGCKTITEFKQTATVDQISKNTFDRFNK